MELSKCLSYYIKTREAMEKLGDEATIAEIATEANVPVDQVIQIQTAMYLNDELLKCDRLYESTQKYLKGRS